jgi:Fe2+ or Zn2+ uptake regulation protein
MRTAPVRPRTVLEALDPDLGGLASGTAEEISENLADRGIDSEPSAVLRTLEVLAQSRKVERVEREEGPPVYTRPEVLLRALGILKPSTDRSGKRAVRR